MKVYAPGKLIISGEHAVVHGAPALAMAVNRYVIASVTQERTSQIVLDLADMMPQKRLSLTGLRQLKNRVTRKYKKFVAGDFSIREVLQKPFELAQFAIGTFVEHFAASMPHGVKIQLQSDVPVGCGMGSSAATILSVMQAVSTYLNVPLTRESLYQLALEAENMQHGKSSGMDLRIILEGGVIYNEGGELKSRSMPFMPLYIVNTGTPLSTTGQCVSAVASHFTPELIAQFSVVTKEMDEALQKNDFKSMQSAMRENHRLLIQIGVVPKRVQAFIADLEAIGAAAKTCGAGAITGEQAGMVLILESNEQRIQAICQQHGYHLELIQCEARGLHIIH